MTIINTSKVLFWSRGLAICTKSLRLFHSCHSHKIINISTRLNTCSESNKPFTRKTSASFFLCRHYALTNKQASLTNSKEQELDLKPDAIDIFKSAIRAVRPKAMIENVLLYNRISSTLKVQDRCYTINRNVFIVGFGNAVLGMARVVEDMLGEHVVTGIISIPLGLQEEIKDAYSNEMFLAPDTKIQVYVGASDNEVDEAGHNASKAIHGLVSNLVETDVLIVLCSAGGSTLCPSPHPPITLKELHLTTELLWQNGANVKEMNIIRKNIEMLKGGGLALAARPAKVLSLVLSSVIGDTADLVASGPTCLTQPTPHHCLEILQRLAIIDKVPDNVRKFLERQAKQINIAKAQTIHDPLQAKAERDAIWQDVQNIVVGNNSIACQAAIVRASELGYFPLILTTVLTGEARDIGFLFAKLTKFVMMCFDRRAGLEPNPELSMLELELVRGGIRKKWINHISNSVDRAHNMNKDICIISGGEIDISVSGAGVGGKCMESALAAAIQLYEEFRVKEMNVAESQMCYLSCDSDGHDGVTKMAGAVIDQSLLELVEDKKLDMAEHLKNNDSYNFFMRVNDGKNLIRTNLTGTNIMDMVILMVQRPKEKKYQWS
ncbi:unnamed protein product [Lymnaea stagnalis]|uniref:Glycerate kinase n=1 Tax=Lymnaea stagnalis TaxID=6523 RepID=A0AAV2IMV7_LYMST